MGLLRRIFKRFTLRRRAKDKFAELNWSDLSIPVPVSFVPGTSSKHYWRRLIRLIRIINGHKPFKKPAGVRIDILHSPWESEWYLKYMGVGVNL